MKPIKRKNETRTFKALQELLPQINIEREVVIREPVYDEDGVLVRHFIIVDFRFFVNGQEYQVEFDGQQHKKPVKKFGGAIAFHKQCIRDLFLKDWCKKNNINLICIDGTKHRGKKIKKYLQKQFKKMGVIK